MADGELPAPTLREITVSVRALCEFGAKRGDLDRRFTPAPTAQQGMAGHSVVQGRRSGHYLREVPLSGIAQGLTIRGRADGFDPELRRLEEIKTHRGNVARIPDNHRQLHWAQARVYGALLCRSRSLESLELALIYFNIDDETETVLTETATAEALEQFLDALAVTYRVWAEREAEHREARNAALAQIRFPHADFNAGQRLLAESVFRAVSQKSALLVQAPTGIGKTVGTLFPALKACLRQPIDKLFYLTAKTPGRQVALEALARIQGVAPERPLRVLEMASRDKSCVQPDKRCNGESCPLARGFYDRLPAARAAAVDTAQLDQPGLRAVAAQHEICPYYLSQEMARWADIVVGDYNYYFDGQALLYALAAQHEWQVAVLVDEAHNLVDRARDMYSATLDPEAIARARRQAPPSLRRGLARIQHAVSDIANVQTEDYDVLDAVPDSLQHALQDFIGDASRLLAEQGDDFPADLQQFFFDALGFIRACETFGRHSMLDSQMDPSTGSERPGKTTLTIRNIVPAPFLAPRFAAAHGAAIFSATLNPPEFYRDLLGLPEATPWLDVPSPFKTEQLDVRIARHVSTRFREREDSIEPIVDLIAEQFQRQPGNYLAFFSSFDYLERALDRLRQRAAPLPVWAQERRMDERARSEFLDRFTASGQGIGFAVLGGVFSEGIDLPGSRLIGAFVVTLGLPQVNPVNEEMARRIDELFGAGYAYTYLYPGLRKVVQAAGRVIRSTEDRGVVVLVDRRYLQPQIRSLLPAWWRL